MYAKQFCINALKEAYYTGDKAFISFISWSYGTIMVHYNEMELAAAYMVNAFELNKNFFAATHDSSAISYLGEILFHARVYDKSIYYTRMAIDSLKNRPGSSFEEVRHIFYKLVARLPESDIVTLGAIGSWGDTYDGQETLDFLEPFLTGEKGYTGIKERDDIEEITERIKRG